MTSRIQYQSQRFNPQVTNLKSVTVIDDQIKPLGNEKGVKEGSEGHEGGTGSPTVGAEGGQTAVDEGVKKKPSDNPSKTRIMVILDESSSMSGQRQEVITGYNDFLRKQRVIEGDEATLSLLKFNTICTWISVEIPVKQVTDLTGAEYTPNGGTALFDAMGMGIMRAEEGINNETERVLCLIITDGEENSSRTYGRGQIQDMVKERESRDNWTFAYIGVNPISVTRDFGIPTNNSIQFCAQSVSRTFRMSSEATVEYRRSSYQKSSSFFLPQPPKGILGSVPGTIRGAALSVVSKLKGKKEGEGNGKEKGSEPSTDIGGKGI
jgi:uncharacterized protein YegL